MHTRSCRHCKTCKHAFTVQRSTTGVKVQTRQPSAQDTCRLLGSAISQVIKFASFLALHGLLLAIALTSTTVQRQQSARTSGPALSALQSYARHSTLTRLRMSTLGQESRTTETEGRRSEKRNTHRLRQTTDLDAADAAEKGGVEREYLFHLRWRHIKTECRLPKAHAASHMHKHTRAHTHTHWRHFKSCRPPTTMLPLSSSSELSVPLIIMHKSGTFRANFLSRTAKPSM